VRKTAIFILVTILYLASCKTEVKEKGFFTITGNFKNSNEELVTLYQRTPFEFIPLDSARITSTGDFSLTAFCSEKDFFVLNAGTDYDIILLIDTAENIEITADLNNIAETYLVKGSKESEKIQRIEHKLAYTKALVDSLGKVYEQYFGTPQFDTIKQNLDSVFFPAFEEQKEFSRKFVDENLNSLVSLIAISQYINPNSPVFDKETDADYYYKVDSVLSAKFPNSPHIEKLNGIVATMKKNITENLTPAGNVTLGSIAPDFKMPTNNGDSLSLSSLRGKYVLVHFWASWCKPCVEENENLKKYFWAFYPKFQIIQISLDQDAAKWKDAIKKGELNWYHVCDLKTWASPVVNSFGVKSLPSNFMIDPQGKIVCIDLLGNDLDLKYKAILDKK
jgi:peroxiredoxin